MADSQQVFDDLMHVLAGIGPVSITPDRVVGVKQAIAATESRLAPMQHQRGEVS